MLRNRTFLFGLGAGLIIAALVLQVIYEAEKVSSGESPIVQTPDTQAPAEPSPLSLDQLREEAEKLGYSLYEQDKKLYSEEELDAKVQEALANAPKSENAGQKYAFSIGGGTDVSTIAYMLVEMGLIDDWREFMDEIKNRKLADSVQARYYIFEEKPDMQELITELTTAGQ